jgi:phospholipid-binding lipoprotein MlaA
VILSRSLELLRLALVAFAFAALAGCATTGGPTGIPEAEKTPGQRADPWENWNRKVFSFNDAVDEAVLKPVAKAYQKVVPELVRRGVTNFFGNFADAWSGVNNLLQGKVVEGATDFMRVATNTVFGIGGLFDVASEAGMEKHHEDFGQTLGHWGLGAGPYMVLPLFGPSTLRDTASLPVDLYASPLIAVQTDEVRWGLTVLGFVNQRANLLGATNLLDDVALDRYSFVRDAYLQRRRSLVHDGDPPSLGDEEPYQPDPSPPAADAASAPASAPAAEPVPVAPAAPASAVPASAAPAASAASS